MKVFLFYGKDNLHSSYKNLIIDPPKNIQLIIPQAGRLKGYLMRIQNSIIIKKLYRATIKKLRISYLYGLLYRNPPRKEVDLIFFLDLYENVNKPYILCFTDEVYSLTGYDYDSFLKKVKKINEDLGSENCKAIVVPFEESKELFMKYFDAKVKKKVRVINYGVEIKKTRKDTSKTTRFLFMGSLSNPDDFLMKGGRETLIAFEKLKKEFNDKVELTVRCKIPKGISAKYNLSGVRVIDKSISSEELKNLYRNSDVLVSPSQVFVAMTPIEAMSFGLPLIALDTFGVREYLKEGYNGFAIRPSSLNDYDDPRYLTILRTPGFLDNAIDDKRVAEEIYLAMKEFCLKPGLIKKMGKNSLKMAKGKYSLIKRREKFEKLFRDVQKLI